MFLDDSPELIKEKIRRAVTDSGKEIKYDQKKKPAVSNLMRIYESFSGQPIKEIEGKFKGKGYGNFKKDLAGVVIDYLSQFQKRKKKIEKDSLVLKQILEAGRKKAQAAAQKTISEVKNKIGLPL